MTTNLTSQVITKSIRYPVPSRTRRGKTHHVSVDPRDGVIVSCTCEAGQYGRVCWHRQWVADGRAGKPIIRVSVRLAAVAA